MGTSLKQSFNLWALVGLLAIPSLSACGSMGFPHIGTVDTRHHAPGTVQVQGSVGGGMGGIVLPGAVGAGAAVSVDTHVTPKLSVPASAHLLFGLAEKDELTGSARVGLRYRPKQKLSLGLGGFGGYSTTPSLGDSHAWNFGGDLEIATSSFKKRHFVSHAWRLSLGRSTRKEWTAAVLGDWSRSIPTRAKGLRFSFGVNYGIAVYQDIVGTAYRLKEVGSDSLSTESGAGFILGAHMGLLWGRKSGPS